MNRRHFIMRSAAAAASIGSGIALCKGQTTRPQATTRSAPAEVTGRQHLDPNAVNEFVGAGHGNLARVREMLAEESPAQKRLGGLILAERELGLGDLETALGGASHMGNREIALYLLSQGARIDAFCAAMLGHRDVVLALLKAVPETAATKGPHGYTLLYHAAISGDTDMAAAIGRLLPAGAKDYNQALHSAAGKGQLEMIRWLLANGVTDVNAKDAFGNTALKNAIKNNFTEIAAELRKRGAT